MKTLIPAVQQNAQNKAHPYLTSEIPGISGIFKQFEDDFDVEEIPAYEPCGEGEHLYLWIEKRGRSTAHLVQDLAKICGIPAFHIGVAGRKDVRARTRQWVSLPQAVEDKLRTAQLAGCQILKVTRHRNKLRVGHLRGNRFSIKLREIDSEAEGRVRQILEMLALRGLPNFFGAQRFGMREDNALVGRAILKNDYAAAVAWISGQPQPEDQSAIKSAREYFAAGDFERAARTWPAEFRNSVRVARVMAKSKGNAKQALLSLGKEMIWFYLTAFQSHLFNQVLMRRLPALDCIWEGDLAFKHDNGAVFLVQNAAEEQPRLDRFEISPSGPLFGYGMTEPQGQTGQMESEILAVAGITKENFREAALAQCPGVRRALRCPVTDWRVLPLNQDEAGVYLTLQFTLSKGSYATALLQEIGKGHLRDASQEDAVACIES